MCLYSQYTLELTANQATLTTASSLIFCVCVWSGVNVFLRKIAVTAASSPAVEITQQGESLSIKTSTSVRTTHVSFTVGQSFNETTVDGRPCTVRSPFLFSCEHSCVMSMNAFQHLAKDSTTSHRSAQTKHMEMISAQLRESVLVIVHGSVIHSFMLSAWWRTNHKNVLMCSSWYPHWASDEARTLQ